MATVDTSGFYAQAAKIAEEGAINAGRNAVLQAEAAANGKQ